MPKINTLDKLVAFVALLVLTFINIIPNYKGEVAVLIAGNDTAQNIINPTVNWITQWAVVITTVVIFLLFIYAIISFVINKCKPDKLSDETMAIRDLSSKIEIRDNALIQEIKGLRGDLTNKVKTNNELDKK
jgi:hypothetical protein